MARPVSSTRLPIGIILLVALLSCFWLFELFLAATWGNTSVGTLGPSLAWTLLAVLAGLGLKALPVQSLPVPGRLESPCELDFGMSRCFCTAATWENTCRGTLDPSLAGALLALLAWPV